MKQIKVKLKGWRKTESGARERAQHGLGHETQ